MVCFKSSLCILETNLSLDMFVNIFSQLVPWVFIPLIVYVKKLVLNFDDILLINFFLL